MLEHAEEPFFGKAKSFLGFVVLGVICRLNGVRHERFLGGEKIPNKAVARAPRTISFGRAEPLLYQRFASDLTRRIRVQKTGRCPIGRRELFNPRARRKDVGDAVCGEGFTYNDPAQKPWNEENACLQPSKKW
jgi:hypothetical protein